MWLPCFLLYPCGKMCVFTHYKPKGTESSATISGYGGGQAWVQLSALRRQQEAVATPPSEGVGFGSPAFSLVWDQVGEGSVQARRGRWEVGSVRGRAEAEAQGGRWQCHATKCEQPALSKFANRGEINIQVIRGRHGTGGGERCVHCWWPLCLQSHRSPQSGPSSVATVMPRLPGLGVGLSASARSPEVSLSERHIPAGPARLLLPLGKPRTSGPPRSQWVLGGHHCVPACGLCHSRHLGGHA